MIAVYVICYLAAAGCFLFSVFRHKFEPTSLDITALGLFFIVVPHILHLLGM